MMVMTYNLATKKTTEVAYITNFALVACMTSVAIPPFKIFYVLAAFLLHLPGTIATLQVILPAIVCYVHDEPMIWLGRLSLSQQSHN